MKIILTIVDDDQEVFREINLDSHVLSYQKKPERYILNEVTVHLEAMMREWKIRSASVQR